MTDLRITRDAQSGEVYVCQACGKTAMRIKDFSDTSCMTWGVLVVEASIKRIGGRIVKADAVQSS